MNPLGDRVACVTDYLAELLRRGLPRQVGHIRDEVLFIVDGVGRFQAAPLLIRRALRHSGVDLPTVYFSWQFGLPFEIWTDLMWLSRNRRVSRRITRELIACRRAHPDARFHLLGLSGGAGISAFALENLRGAAMIDTYLLGCPALSPQFDLSPALRSVQRCYALVSSGDRVVLGLGTTLFGTTDRRHQSSAGRVGFRMPDAPAYPEAYARLRQIRWTHADRELFGHCGGHAGWVQGRFLARHLTPLLAGSPALPTEGIDGAGAAGPGISDV